MATSQAIGIDLGGSHVTAAVIADGAIVERFTEDIEDHDVEIVVGLIEKTARKAITAAKISITAIGIGSPGNIDPKTGTVRYSPNFGWKDVPLAARITERLKLPVFVANDARCATLGEHAFGIGAGTTDFVLLTLGTGIGGGIISRGQLLLGNEMGAGEIGHHQIRVSDGFFCGCGKIGCFEAQASGQGLLRHAQAVAPSFPGSELLIAEIDKKGRRERIGSKRIRKAAEDGDKHAVAAWQHFCRDLATGIANVVAFVNPQIVALGGGVASAGDFLVTSVRPIVEELTTMVPRGTTRIEAAKLGNDAGPIGAASMALAGGL